MISKVIPGHSFYGSISYILQDQKHAEVLKVEGVRGHNKKLMIEDFVRQHQLRPEKKQACFHSILSFAHGEKPDNKVITAIAEKYLEQLNITDTQYAIMKHSDKKHLHVHVIANMVNNEGNSISDNWIGLKGKKTAQRLTLEYKLQQAISKKLELTNLDGLRSPDKQRYVIYQTVKNILPRCHSLDELKGLLQKEGIELLYKYKGQTNEKQGISFQLGKYKFKGSEIDRKYSLVNLEKVISVQQKLKIESVFQQVRSPSLTKTPLKINRYKYESSFEAFTKPLGKEFDRTIRLILQPTFTSDSISPELLREARKKRKRKRISR